MSGLGSTTFDRTLEKALSGSTITPILQIYIDYFAVLVNSTP
jgi:hypothetical protein